MFFVFFFFQHLFLYGQNQIVYREGVGAPLKEGIADSTKQKNNTPESGDARRLVFEGNSTVHIIGDVKVFGIKGGFVYIRNNEIARADHPSGDRKAEKNTLISSGKKKERIASRHVAKKKKCFLENSGPSEEIHLCQGGSFGIDLSRIYFWDKDKIVYESLFQIYIKEDIVSSSDNPNHSSYSKVFSIRPPPSIEIS